jgi:hypothetical protein
MSDANRIPADRLLAELVERRWVELRGNTDRAQLVEHMSRMLDQAKDPHQRAASLAEWLMSQESVAELYASDEELAALLEQQIH